MVISQVCCQGDGHQAGLNSQIERLDKEILDLIQRRTYRAQQAATARSRTGGTRTLLLSEARSHRIRAAQDYLPKAGRGRQVVGFFPGLGSRAFYQNLDRGLLDAGVPEVVEIYQESARALGLPGQPERLLMIPENMPAGKLAAQGFVGAAFLVHSLALEAHLRAMAENERVPVHFVGYTGESLGIITAAVASGAISVGDGVRLGYAFTPLMLTAADGLGPDDSLAADMAAYLPESLRGRQLVPEPNAT